MRSGNREIKANRVSAQGKKKSTAQLTGSNVPFLYLLVFYGSNSYVFLRQPSGRQKADQSYSGRGGKSKALCFPASWVKGLSVNIPAIRKIWGQFKASCFPFSTFVLRLQLTWGGHRRFGCGRKGRGKGEHRKLHLSCLWIQPAPSLGHFMEPQRLWQYQNE